MTIRTGFGNWRRTRPLAHRFWEKVVKTESCWLWMGAKNRCGYGQLTYQKKHITAHRASLMIHGVEIPAGMMVCHSCDNPPCVNPQHLWIGTNSDNQKDSVRKGRNVPPPSRLGVEARMRLRAA